MFKYSSREKEWIWLASIEGIGAMTFVKLLNTYGTAGLAIQALKNDVQQIPFIKKNTIEKIQACMHDQYIDRFIEILQNRNIHAICMFHPEYPEELKHIYDPPPVLYCRGNTTLLNHPRPLAVIGTRKPSRYGREVTQKLAGDLAKQDVCIVSGLARGIDACAHAGAVQVDGATIAVLGCGVEKCYPSENKALYMDILKKDGLIVSEYIPGTQSFPQNFPARNRIISGISRAVLVTEAAKKSGTHITIDFAQEQGKDVLAVPGNISNPLSMTPNMLIRDGSPIILEYSDVMDWLGWSRTSVTEDKGVYLRDMDKQERAVFNAIDVDGSRFDEILSVLDFAPAQLMSLLSRMELRGMIVKLAGNRYARA